MDMFTFLMHKFTLDHQRDEITWLTNVPKKKKPQSFFESKTQLGIRKSVAQPDFFKLNSFSILAFGNQTVFLNSFCAQES